jgi:hypothetical protein
MRRRAMIIVLFAAAIGVTAAAASGGVRVVGNCTHSEVRPASIILACADANAAFTRLRWSSFGGVSADASGQFTFNDCNPSCVAGHVHSYPVAVVFSKPRRCPDGHRDYRLAVASYSSAARPPGAVGGKGKPGRLTLFCPRKQ